MGNGSKTPTVDQLRKEIDRGQTADKVAGVDPAAAPLGTDAEAGGNPATPEQREMEARSRPHEAPRRPTAGGDATESIRRAEVPDGASRSAAASPATQAGEEMPERGGRVAGVKPSREDDAAGTRGDDPSPPSRRHTAEP